MKPIAIFYHCLFQIADELLPNALEVVHEQMRQLQTSGLEAAATEIHCGVNGGPESAVYAQGLLPARARIAYHGLQSRAENLTLVMLEEWAKSHEGWHVLYFHAKGATHALGSDYGTFAGNWRRGMMEDVVDKWRQCVEALDSGHDIACSHWMWNMGDGTQHIPAGNFLWVRSDFVRSLPSIFLRDRIKQSGIDSLESRYEAEVYWGNGPRPRVMQFKPAGGGGVP